MPRRHPPVSRLDGSLVLAFIPLTNVLMNSTGNCALGITQSNPGGSKSSRQRGHALAPCDCFVTSRQQAKIAIWREFFSASALRLADDPYEKARAPQLRPSVGWPP
jgi:hypothetical protein